jgi:hypothetical protein
MFMDLSWKEKFKKDGFYFQSEFLNPARWLTRLKAMVTGFAMIAGF